MLTNIELIETPTMQNAIKNNLVEKDNILKEQIFLQENGVSFSYTDSTTYMERKDLVLLYVEYIEKKNEKIEEATRKNKRS